MTPGSLNHTILSRCAHTLEHVEGSLRLIRDGEARQLSPDGSARLRVALWDVGTVIHQLNAVLTSTQHLPKD